MMVNNVALTPIEDLMALSLNENECAFVYFDWAGILLKAKQRMVAFDLASYVLNHNQYRGVSYFSSLDLQFNSHIHRDHFDVKCTTQLFQQTGAKIIVESDIFKMLTSKVPPEALIQATPGHPIEIKGITIHSIKGIHLCPISLFYIEWASFRVFHGGDSDYVPLNMYQPNLAFIPTGSPSPTCSPEKGLKMTLDLKPAVVVPIHGSKSQMRKFSTLVSKELPETEVVIPEKNIIIKISGI